MSVAAGYRDGSPHRCSPRFGCSCACDRAFNEPIYPCLCPSPIPSSSLLYPQFSHSDPPDALPNRYKQSPLFFSGAVRTTRRASLRIPIRVSAAFPCRSLLRSGPTLGYHPPASAFARSPLSLPWRHFPRNAEEWQEQLRRQRHYCGAYSPIADRDHRGS